MRILYRNTILNHSKTDGYIGFKVLDLILKMLWLNLIFYLWTTQFQETIQNVSDPHDNSSSFGVPTLLLDSLQLTLSSKLLLDVYSPRFLNLKGYLGWLPKRSTTVYSSCSGEDSLSESICLKYGKDTKLLIKQNNAGYCEAQALNCETVTCHEIHWANHIGGAMDCFVLGEDDWYGGGISLNQKWPIQGDMHPWFPAVTGDPIHHPFSNIAENLWLSSSGFAIYVEESVPLFVSFNESGSGKLCFTTSSKKHPYKNEDSKKRDLIYSICSASSIKDAYIFSINKWVKKPKGIPDENVFQYPIWSTWARYKSRIDENTTMRFAHEIKRANFPTGQFEIDDKWESCYGNLEFDLKKFSDPKIVISNLKKIGFSPTLWVHPFCNSECELYNIGQTKNFWVKNKEGKTLNLKWWNGDVAAVLDVTNRNAVEWFVGRLKSLQSKYGVTSFKFDAGEVLWLEENFIFYEEAANLQPNLYSKYYAEMASQFGGRVEVRVGYRSQELPIFVRMFDKFSRWDYENGLRTLIPHALQLSMLGYFFILPDMVGGNNYASLNNSLPDRELYIRWLEATVFLPVIQFSIAPWDYDDEIVAIARNMVNLHDKYTNYILNLAKQATVTGEPIIRPLWWIASDDLEAQRTDSQFLVGDGILVAPVLEKGHRTRDIYLPEGKWADVQRGTTYEGSQWLFDYDAPLNFLPFFIRHS